MNDSTTATEEKVNVVVRIRPLQGHEIAKGQTTAVRATSNAQLKNEVEVKVGPQDAQLFRCSKCFSHQTTQGEFFEESGIVDLLDSAMAGYRVCAFAFGQTGAGKTYTVFGPPKHNGVMHRDDTGMLDKSLEYIFSKLSDEKTKSTVKISCLEIYHEQVYDLFADPRERTGLQCREHASDGFFMEGCKMIPCGSHKAAGKAIEFAMKNRQTGSHDLNNRSSRSHCVTDIFIELAAGGTIIDGGLEQTEGGDQIRLYNTMGRITIVDLAGSERLKDTKSHGKVLQEAGFINKSIYVLGKVIAGLSRTGDCNHRDVPFRDSKLTKLLINSLGILTTISSVCCRCI